MIFLDLIDLHKIRKGILYVFAALVALWLQTDVFSHVTVWGVKPMLVPVIVTAVGLFEGGVWGGLLGLAVGAYLDMNLVDSTVTFLILLSAYGFFSGVLGEYLLNRRFLSYMLLTAAALLVTALWQIFPLWIFRGVSLGTLLPIALLQALLGVPFAPPAYFACKRIAGRRKL